MFRDIAEEVFRIESQTISNLANLLTDDFDRAVDFILSTSNRIIICGMGKSRIIGKKIAATIARTETPSFSMHSGEACHGDLGVVTKEDVFIVISNSGGTDAALKPIPYLALNENKVISITGNLNSALAKNSRCHINIKADQEAYPLRLAPTTSATGMAAVGDAMTETLTEARNFESEGFARFHLGAVLGIRLLNRVKSLANWSVASCYGVSAFRAVVSSITSGKIGACLVAKDSGSKPVKSNVVDVIRGGNLRRTMSRRHDSSKLNADQIMGINPKYIDSSASSAKDTMGEKQVTFLLV